MLRAQYCSFQCRLLCPLAPLNYDRAIHLVQYFHRVMTLGMRLRSAVIAAVYNKAMVLSTSAKQTTTTGEMVNLMAVDAQV